VLYDRCYGNTIYYNNFINNSYHQRVYYSHSCWDNGYPLGGNYWSDYNGTDLYSGPYQNETGSDGIGDTPYTFTDLTTGATYKDTYPLMKPYASRHDIAVINVITTKMDVRGGDYIFDIKVTVKNLGDYIESFNVTSFFNSSEIGRQEIVAFEPDAERTLTFSWNVTAIEQGIYTIKAMADTVAYEENITNNECIVAQSV